MGTPELVKEAFIKLPDARNHLLHVQSTDKNGFPVSALAHYLAGRLKDREMPSQQHAPADAKEPEVHVGFDGRLIEVQEAASFLGNVALDSRYDFAGNMDVSLMTQHQVIQEDYDRLFGNSGLQQLAA